MKLFQTNLGDTATLTSSSQDSAFPAVNVQDLRPAKPWKTGITLAGEWLLFDLGAAALVAACILHAHNFDGTETGVRIQGNATNAWGAPTVDVAIPYTAVTMGITFPATSLRYWRLTFTKATPVQVKSIGRVFLGPVSDTGDPGMPKYGGLKKVWNDPSVVEKAIGNQKFADVKSKFYSLKLDFTHQTQANHDIYEALFKSKGTSTPWFLQVDALTWPEFMYLSFTKPLAADPLTFQGGTNYSWDMAMDLEEYL